MDMNLEAKLLGKIRIIQPEKTRERSEKAVADLYAELFSDILRYNVTTKSWWKFDGRRWIEDVGGMYAAQLAKILYSVLKAYASRGSFEAEDDDPRKKYLLFILKYGEYRRRETLVKDARSLMYVSNEDFDRNANLLNCHNCTLDLSSMETHEHMPKDMLTKISGCDYNPDADHSRWAEFIDQIMQGNGEKASYLQRVCGYALTADCSLEKAFFLYGSSTRNGKSTFVETFRAMMGDYASVMQPESLEQAKHKNGSNATPDIACLAGVRFLSVPEPRKNMLLDVSLFKVLTGGDTIKARKLYENGFEFQPHFKLFMHCNSLPVVTDDTLFQSERVRIITFDRHFEEHEQNQNLKHELREGEILSSVLNWAIVGLNDLRENGENPPACVMVSTNQYKEKSDKIMSFFDECMEQADKNTAGGDVYKVYGEWCKDNERGVEGRQRFFLNLREHGLMRKSGTVDGITVRNVVTGYVIGEAWLDVLQG